VRGRRLRLSVRIGITVRISGGAATVALALSACSSGNYRYLPSPNAPAREANVDSSLDSLEARPSPLATQSQRDVDLILQRRDAANQSQTAAPIAPVIDSAVHREIIWNETKTQPAAKTAANAAAAAGGQQALLRAPTEIPARSIEELPGGATDAVAHPSLNPDRLTQLMVDLGRELYANGAYSDAPMRQLLMIAAMSMVDPDRTIDAQAVPDLSEKERELLAKLQAFFAELGRSLDGSHDVERTIIESVAKLRESIIRPPQLKLTTAALCTRVGGFGDYSQFNRHAFLAHSEQKVIVYLEIDEFTSELNDKGEYVTELAQQLTIYADRDGIPVWGGGDWQTAVDVTKNQRKDFFTVQVVTLPKALSVGKYQLKVRVRDEKSGAEAETAIAFEMVADPKMAAGAPGK
jgi:hypothetical protein